MILIFVRAKMFVPQFCFYCNLFFVLGYKQKWKWAFPQARTKPNPSNESTTFYSLERKVERRDHLILMMKAE